MTDSVRQLKKCKLGDINQKLIALLVLSRIHFCDYLLQLSFGLALREIVHIVILGRCLDQPLGFHIGHCANIVLCRQHKFVVEHPLGLVVQAGRGVKLYNLVVLDRKVVAGALKMGNLSTKKRLIKQSLA